MNVLCPRCGEEIELANPCDGMRARCSSCNQKFEISVKTTSVADAQVQPWRPILSWTLLAVAFGVIGASLLKFEFVRKPISDGMFYALIGVSVVLFYVQWRVCKDVWSHIRCWLRDHIWVIVFIAMTFMLVQTYLIVRQYNRNLNRYRSLSRDISGVESDVCEVQSAIEDVKSKLGDINTAIINFGYDFGKIKPKSATNQCFGF